MKRRHINIVLALATLLAFTAPPQRAQDASSQRVSPARNWGLSFTSYSQYREDYDSLPLRVVKTRGGKLSPNEKFKVEVSGVLNRSDKSITGAEFCWYLFDRADLDKAVDSGTTPLIKLTLSPNEELDLEVFVLHVEDLPFLRDKNPHGTFLLEVGVKKVVYSDGSAWEATGSPGKFDHSKVR